MRVTLLTGGVGGSKLALGFYRSQGCELTAIANTGDDIVMHGLHVSPDPDILMYTLAGLVNPDTGWGFRDETFTVGKQLAGFGHETWFQLGDRDFATHIHRTAMLSAGATLSEAVDAIRRSLGISARVLPMSDDPVATMLDTDEGRMHLQEYFVRRRCEPVVRAIEFDGAQQSRPAPGVIEAITAADLVVIAPSNPLISIGPILAVPGIRESLCRRREHVVSVCPLVGGRSLKGPTDKMMAQLGYAVTPGAIALMYADFCGAMVVDPTDDGAAPAVEAAGVCAVCLPTVMQTENDKIRLARLIIERFQSNF